MLLHSAPACARANPMSTEAFICIGSSHYLLFRLWPHDLPCAEKQTRIYHLFSLSYTNKHITSLPRGAMSLIQPEFGCLFVYRIPLVATDSAYLQMRVHMWTHSQTKSIRTPHTDARMQFAMSISIAAFVRRHQHAATPDLLPLVAPWRCRPCRCCHHVLQRRFRQATCQRAIGMRIASVCAARFLAVSHSETDPTLTDTESKS